MEIPEIERLARKLLGCLILILCSTSGYSQLVEYPISGQPAPRPGNPALRTQDFGPLTLPFWDDFSYSDTEVYPRPDFWQFRQSVFLNNGLGINPPSKNVATFDGVDSLGKPYNVNDILAKGLADKLVSLPIRMDLVDPAVRNTVYISFYYQVKGLGESPDNGDLLSLSFLNSDSKWEVVYSIENSDALQPDIFYQVVLPISDARFFHEKFQFRFQNFSRLSGPFDTWHVDYIYLNAGRSPADTSYPDRTVSSSLNSLFPDYFAMPSRHFFENPAANLKKPSLTLYNLRSGNLQPFDYTTSAKITTRLPGGTTTTVIPLDAAQDPGAILTGQQFLSISLNKIPSQANLDPASDSISIQLKFGMSTKDNVPPAQNGDYDPSRYSPIDFRYNDSTRTNYLLGSYYAYDDGRAEYGAGLNQAGSFLACKFLMKSDRPDTIVSVDIYFPQFGDNSSQSIQLEIRKDLTDALSTILIQQSVLVTRTSQNNFTTYKLINPIIVSGDFYVGWKQISTASIPAGLDKNNDNGDKVFYNTNGAWVQNTTVKGSLMIRPRFGAGGKGSVVTALEPQETHIPIYPNPATRICYLPAGAGNVVVRDITGRALEVELQPYADKTALTFLSAASGWIMVRYDLNGKVYTEKIMVQAN